MEKVSFVLRGPRGNPVTGSSEETLGTAGRPATPFPSRQHAGQAWREEGPLIQRRLQVRFLAALPWPIQACGHRFGLVRRVLFHSDG